MKADRGDSMWKYVKPLKSEDLVSTFLRKYQIELPAELYEVITKNNGGRPPYKIFRTIDGVEHVFKSLLSYNEGDSETIYGVYPALFEASPLYPIGSDSAGNFICYDTKAGGYIFLDHELNRSVEIEDMREIIAVP